MLVIFHCWERERERKGSSAICDDFLAVSTLVSEDTDGKMPYSNCGSLEWMREGLQIHCSLLWSYYASISYVTLASVWFDVQDSPYKKSDANFISRVILDQSLYHAAFHRCSPLKRDKSLNTSFSWPVWLISFCNCAVRSWNIDIRCMLTPPAK